MNRLNIDSKVGAEETRQQTNSPTQPTLVAAETRRTRQKLEVTFCSNWNKCFHLSVRPAAAQEMRKCQRPDRSTSSRRWLRRPVRIGGALVILSAFHTSAGEIAPDSLIGADPNPLQPLVDGILGKYGWITTVILVIGCLRIVFKPVMLALENYVKQTPGTSDDDRLAKFESGPVYKVIAFVLDLGASIKLPLITPPTDPNRPKE